MQGRPLKIIAYGIGILPLIKNLKQELPKINHPWYHDNAGALGRFVIIDIYFNLLTCQELECSYYPKPSKSILIIHPDNIEAIKLLGARHWFKVCTGARYLGGYIGSTSSNTIV